MIVHPPVRYYPINLDVKGRKVVVIGAGSVAARKVRALLRAGSRPLVVAPRLTASLARLVREGRVQCRRRVYRRGDLQGACLAIAATNDPKVQRAIRREADVRGVLLNVVDVPGLCDFTHPALVERGDLLLTISTGGQAPGLAKELRKQLEKDFGKGYGRLVRMMSQARRHWKDSPLKERLRLRRQLVQESLARFWREDR